MNHPKPEPVVRAPGRFRRWLRSDMRVLRWIFLALYVLIVGGLLVYALAEVREIGLIVTIVAMVAAQLLILGTGTIQLCRPIRKRRLVLPVVAAAFMMTVLTAGLIAAMIELFYVDRLDLPFEEILFPATVGLSWIGWGVLLFNHVKHRPRGNVLSRLTGFLFTGSLAELLVTVPSHVIVSRRPGCFVGMATAFGIIAGLCVMLFSFGPMIVLLFLRPRWRAEIESTGVPYCPACGYDLRASRERCPECGLPFENGEA